jgi:mannose/fructose/N-acetylgalactosamine-specific phosphotransferase system component IIB
MNEQIFKLALKAMDFQGAIDIDTELKMTNSELAKFAELIVKECVTVAMRAVSDDEPKEAWYLIKQHFGVEL